LLINNCLLYKFTAYTITTNNTAIAHRSSQSQVRRQRIAEIVAVATKELTLGLPEKNYHKLRLLKCEC